MADLPAPDPPALGSSSLPAASSLLTSWWSADLLVTPHPARIWQGRVLQVVSERSLAYALGRLGEHVGSFQPTSTILGAGAWQVTGETKSGLLCLCLPAVLDEPDTANRARRDLPARVVEHADVFLSAGLRRYLVPPSHFVRLDGTLPVVAWPVDSAYRPLTFRDGRLDTFAQAPTTAEARSASPPARGADVDARTAELMTEVVAALVYHYRPDVDGGSTIADVVINDGDFRIRSGADGRFELRLQLARRLQGGVRPEALLLQLVQLHAYEVLRLGADDLGLPCLVSSPSIALSGLVRGRRYRALDLGLSLDDAANEAVDWIRRFGRTVGRSYRPWIEQFLRGELPPRFGQDPREGHTNLAPLRQRQHVLELGVRLLDRAEDARAARDYQAFIQQRSSDMLDGAAPSAATDGAVRRPISPASEAEALAACLTFEEYMNGCLHDPAWGYYCRRVQIGRRGHFDTHPESLSPDYGAWVAARAHAAWRDLVRAGELGEGDRFVLVEFGAGNGRLARDILDAVRRLSEEGDSSRRESWQTFGRLLDYRIYELSTELAERQRALLGRDAVVLSGDARRPEECLRRDFPRGLRGLVVTNEVPDAFGVHRVLLQKDAPSLAALVLPRLEAEARARLPAELARGIQVADRRLRELLDLSAPQGEEVLDRDAFQALMVHVAEAPSAERELLLTGLWFSEVWIRAEAIPSLGRHLAEHQGAYRRALDGRTPDALLHVNVHAADFIRGLGAALAAGFVITIDYGGSTAELARTDREGRIGLRTYGLPVAPYCPRVNDPYLAPGQQDLTTDIDFSDLARVGRSVGLEVIHYGPESDVAGTALRDVLASPERFAPLLGEHGFKVLVQGTRASEFFGSEGLTPLELD